MTKKIFLVFFWKMLQNSKKFPFLDIFQAQNEKIGFFGFFSTIFLKKPDFFHFVLEKRQKNHFLNSIVYSCTWGHVQYMNSFLNSILNRFFQAQNEKIGFFGFFSTILKKKPIFWTQSCTKKNKKKIKSWDYLNLF